MGTQSVRIVKGTKRFGDVHALEEVDLSIPEGDFLGVLGRSGGGKSTLLRVLAGLDTLTTGEVQWRHDGTRPRTGVVFQQPLLLPWLTVAQNVSLAGRFAAHRHEFDSDYAATLLARFGLEGFADRYPEQLSGGQAQRISVLRAAATRPRLLLLDEPFSALDPATRSDLQRWLADLAAQIDATVVLVTHDVDEALALAHRIILLDTGRIRREWTDVRTDPDPARLRADVLGEYRPDPVPVP